MAARAGVRASIRHPKLYNDININGTLNLLNLTLKHEVEKFIFASSSSVYGCYKYLPINEDHPTQPISPYGISKLAAEKYCLFFDKAYGLKTICIRIFTAYGPRQRPDEAICKFTKLIFSDKPVTIYGDGEQVRDFTYIDDIVNGFILAMKKNVHGIALNIGSGRKVSVNELVDLLEKYSKRKVKRVYVEKHVGDVPATHADISKARQLLGYKPKVDIEEGIKRFIEWFEKSV